MHLHAHRSASGTYWLALMNKQHSSSLQCCSWWTEPMGLEFQYLKSSHQTTLSLSFLLSVSFRREVPLDVGRIQIICSFAFCVCVTGWGVVLSLMCESSRPSSPCGDACGHLRCVDVKSTGFWSACASVLRFPVFVCRGVSIPMYDVYVRGW